MQRGSILSHFKPIAKASAAASAGHPEPAAAPHDAARAPEPAAVVGRPIGDGKAAGEVRRTSVVNRKTTRVWDVSIGRPGIWGNPFVIGRDGTREEVIAKHARWIRTRPDLLKRLPELRGRRLACFCKPLACHGDTLAKLADAL
jgi:hypothetical protein